LVVGFLRFALDLWLHATLDYGKQLAELDAVQEKLRGEGLREGAWRISRFKGLGEMNAEQLWDTTLNPDTRRLARVRHGGEGVRESATMFELLMARGEASQRRAWLEEKGNLADVDV
jgi:topoisomerase-4 subunit B